MSEMKKCADVAFTVSYMH